MKKVIIGVMGPGEKPKDMDLDNAYEAGKRIAQEGWVLLSGGRNQGVMDAVNKGAKEAGGVTIGIIPDSDKSRASEYVDYPIVTGIGAAARNIINILTSDLIIAIGIGCGTTAEIVLAIKVGKKVVLLNDSQKSQEFFKELGGESIIIVKTPEEAIEISKKILQ